MVSVWQVWNVSWKPFTIFSEDNIPYQLYKGIANTLSSMSNQSTSLSVQHPSFHPHPTSLVKLELYAEAYFQSLIAEQ